MLKTVGRSLCLYLLFTVEIRVHADTLWLQEPEACEAGESHCVWQAKKPKAVAAWNGQSLTADKKAIIEFAGENTWRLVKGVTLWKSDSEGKLDVPYADVAGHGQLLVSRLMDRTELTTIEGEFQVKAKVGGQSSTLPEGFSIQVRTPNAKGEVMDLPQPAVVEKTLRAWFNTFSGPRNEFKVEAKRWLSQVELRATMASEWQQGLLSRQLASEREQERERARIRKIEEKKQAEMRELFRKMNYIDP